MLTVVGSPSVADLLDEIIPGKIRRRDTMDLPPALSEEQALAECATMPPKMRYAHR